MQYPTISEYVKAIQDAGDNLDKSTEATNAELNEAITDEFGVKYSKDGRKLLKAPYELNGTYSIRKGTKIICDGSFCHCESLECIVIPDSVTSIGNRAFHVCRSLTDIVIPDSVNSIGAWAFEGCHSLTDIVIPDGVTSIVDEVFSDCESLSSLILPESVTSIGESAFSGCESLSSFVIPENVTSIGDGAFSDCCSLSSLVVPGSVVNLKGNPFCRWDGELKCLSPYFIYEDDVLFNKDKSKIIAFSDKKATSYVIPDSVTSIVGESI